jgi:D-arginine dehydrogenase
VSSGRFYRKPPPGFADHPLLTPRGALIAGRADQQAALQKAAADYARLVPSVRWLDPGETLRRQPLLKPEAAAGGAIFEPEADDMDVAAIHGGFLRGARTAGAVLRLEAEITTLERKDGQWTIGLRDGESLAAKTVVNAAGAWADVVAKLAGARPVGLLPKRRTAFTFDAPPDLDLVHLPMVIDFDESWYFKPEVGQFLASPADETPSPPCDAQPEEMDIAIAVERIETATTLQIRRIKNKWAGLRSFVADKNLVVGYDPTVEGLFWLAGQGGYGIQTAESAGRLAASLALGRGMPGDIAGLGVSEAALSPARFTQG